MKNISSILLLFSILIFIITCKKEDDNSIPEISYPTTYNDKLNILIDSSFVVKPGIKYSLAAYLPKGTSIKIECIPTDKNNWGAAGFVIEERKGYTFQNNYPNNNVFEAIGENDYVNVPVMFGESGPIDPTSIDFIIYENKSDTVARVKTVRSYKLN